jgi:FkbM family methyltransferase
MRKKMLGTILEPFAECFMTFEVNMRIRGFFSFLFSISVALQASSISLDEQTELEWKINVFQINRDRFQLIECHKNALALFYIQPGDIAVDVGAWMGDFAHLFSTLAGRTGVIIAYEASPFIFRQLRSRLGNISNLILRDKAVSSCSHEIVPMKVFPNNVYQQCSSIDQRVWAEIDRVQNQERITQVPVETESLDDFFELNNLGRCCFIKIDVEGHEELVIKGAEKMLRNFRPIVIFEYRHVPGYFEPVSIKQFQELNYRCFDLTSLEEVYYPYIHRDPTDLLAVPEEKVARFLDLRALFRGYW